jgi:hypothetical protein
MHPERTGWIGARECTPHGLLYVPITGPGASAQGPGAPFGHSTGEIRRYDVDSKKYDILVPAFGLPGGGHLQGGWYLTFGKTDSATLAYGQHDEEHDRCIGDVVNSSRRPFHPKCG